MGMVGLFAMQAYGLAASELCDISAVVLNPETGATLASVDLRSNAGNTALAFARERNNATAILLLLRDSLRTSVYSIPVLLVPATATPGARNPSHCYVHTRNNGRLHTGSPD